jgi:hypothetical protein
MRLVGRALFVLAAVTFVAGMATCHFGIEHEIAKMPAEQRAGMTDTDWVGAEWGLRAMFIEACAIAVFVIAMAFRAWERSHASKSRAQG